MIKPKSRTVFMNFIGHWWTINSNMRKEEREIAAQKSLNPSYDKKIDKGEVFISHMILCGIISFIGIEPVKVIFRKNFGAGGIDVLCLSLSCLIFCLLGAISCVVGTMALLGTLDDYGLKHFIQSEGGGISFIIVGILYIGIAFYSLQKGLKEAKLSIINKKPAGYKGDSTLLAVLKKEGWSQERIQSRAEPLVTVLIGISISLFNILGGIPIIICGLSLWVYSIIDDFFIKDHLSDTAKRMNNANRDEDDFNNVETDI